MDYGSGIGGAGNGGAGGWNGSRSRRPGKGYRGGGGRGQSQNHSNHRGNYRRGSGRGEKSGGNPPFTASDDVDAVNGYHGHRGYGADGVPDTSTNRPSSSGKNRGWNEGNGQPYPHRGQGHPGQNRRGTYRGRGGGNNFNFQRNHDNQRPRSGNPGSFGEPSEAEPTSRLNPNAAQFYPRNASNVLAEVNQEIENGEDENKINADDTVDAPENSGNESSPRLKNGESANPTAVDLKQEAQGFRNNKRRQLKCQRDVLIEQLNRNSYECMVCCEKVRVSQPIWSCARCFNFFHLHCIKKWASSSADENGWRCPGCQSYYESIPKDYYCFCGQMKNPKGSRFQLAHTCGQQCGRRKPGGLHCTHFCLLQCHPGPCPPCEVQQTRSCGCGKTSATVLCGSKAFLSCNQTCNKSLECGTHKCAQVCHGGECGPCDKKITHECYCSSERKEVPCTRSNNESRTYSCSKPCKKPLSCGQHNCDSICHSGPCGPCKTSLEAIISCPCGQTPITEACKIAKLPPRKKCSDPIPTCGKVCRRILPCGGGNDERHYCEQKCHLDKLCPPCKKTSKRICRCGSKTVELPCKELRAENGEEIEITCQKKCTKKRSCGKHKCNLKCCIDIDHICTIVCQRQLRCGIHNCTNLCHLNPCPPCGIVSFDELSCECGASVIYPPVPCGTRRPPCQLPCSRQHPCDHPVHHPCHSEPNCPPCTVLTERWCYGKHELRRNVMCHITQVSCGLPCGKKLSCNRHSCPKICHPEVCLEEGETCKLPCDVVRKCGHKCGMPCHDGDCPDTKCKIMANVNCPCGRRNETLICYKRENEYDRTVTWEYHKELKRLEESATKKGETLEITEAFKERIMEEMKAKIPVSQVLECDKECAKIERNRKLAEALQVENADVTTSIGTPNYSEFLTKFAKKNPQFIEMVHKQLTDLVMKAKQSRKKNETYGFNSMNRDKRHVVHEYSDHFGILSESFDEEPNRNVVCFASKEKSYLPSVSLVEAVFRPPPIRSERLKPHDDVSFLPERRAQIVGPSNWAMRAGKSQTAQTQMVALNIPGASTANQSSDFPPL